MFYRMIFLLIPLVMNHSDSQAADWPQFLGPNRNGISTEKNLIDHFPDAGPKIVWRTDLGVGMSGIAIANKTALTLYQDSENQYVIALNALTGEIQWKTPVALVYKNGMGDGPRATAVIDQNQVFAQTGEGILVCLSFENGEILWSVDPFEKLGGKPAEYGMACSPILTDENVIMTIGSPQATVAALNRKSGDISWTAGSGNPAGYSSPALLKVGPQIQLVVFHGRGVMGLDPQTGEDIWSYPFLTDYNCNIATPISVGNNVLISAGENHGTVLLKVPHLKEGPVEEIWKTFGNRSVFRNEWQTSILIDGDLYGFDNIGSAGPVTNLTCVQAKDGEVKWQKRRFGKGNMIAADGKLWCATMDGDLVIVRASPDKFEELDRVTIMGQTRQAPALSDGFLYLRDGAEMICIDISQTSK